MSNKSREKELARAAAKREDEKRSARRKRSLMTGALLVVAVLIGATIGYALVSGGDDTPSAAPSSEASPASPEPDPADGPCDFTPPADLKAKTPYSKQPAMSVDPNRSYTATIDTSCGKMKNTTEQKSRTATRPSHRFCLFTHLSALPPHPSAGTCPGSV